MERFASLRHRTNGKEQLSTLILDRRETLTEVGRKELEWALSQLNPLIQQFNERITGTAEITLLTPILQWRGITILTVGISHEIGKV